MPGASFAGPWIFLFPATYAAHIAEEFFGGFVARFSQVSGLAVSDQAFLAANGFFFGAMCALVIWALQRPSRALAIVMLATIVLVNTTIHAVDAIVSASYSPGIITGLTLWLPLGAWTLLRASRMLPARSVRRGVILGLVAHLLVPVVGVGFILALGGDTT
jgi:hypothetical protein